MREDRVIIDKFSRQLQRELFVFTSNDYFCCKYSSESLLVLLFALLVYFIIIFFYDDAVNYIIHGIQGKQI